MTIYVNIFLNKFEKGPLLTSSLLGQILLRPAITYIEISRPYTIQALPQRCNGTQILPLRTSYFRNTPIGTSYYVVPIKPDITRALPWRQCYSHTHWGHILLTPSQRHSVTLTLTEATYYPCPLRDTVLLSHSQRPHITHALSEKVLLSHSLRLHITHALSETQCYSHTDWCHILPMPSQRHSVTLTLTEVTYYSCSLRDTALLSHPLRPHYSCPLRDCVTLTLTEATYYSCSLRDTVLL